MEASIDISYYPLSDSYKDFIVEFILSLKKNHPNLNIETNGFSTQIFGEYDQIMSIFQNEIRHSLEKHKCVFAIKLAPGTRTAQMLPDELKD
jgi:uncharacterized protein YqgV (UPF0045/DUF77 family)